MVIYELPLWERYKVVSDPAIYVKCLQLDELGFFVYYRNEKELENESFQKLLSLLRRRSCLVEAWSPEQAIRIFHNEWEGAQVGGAGEEFKALRIACDKYILELPCCELLHKNKRGEYVCGEAQPGGNGEWGMCVLAGFHTPWNCPITRFRDAVSERRRRGPAFLPIETIEIGDRKYNFLRAKNIQLRFVPLDILSMP